MSGNSGDTPGETPIKGQTQGTRPQQAVSETPALAATAPGIHDFGHFLLWEQASRDAIMVKRIYIDMADDIIAGLMLSQIIYWHLPTDQGQTRLRIVKDGVYWLAKTHAEWWDECRLTADQSRRAIKILKEKGLVITQVMKFAGSPTVHLRLDQQRFLVELNRYGLKPISKWDKPQNQMGANPNPFGINPTSYKQTLPADTTADTTAATENVPPNDRPTRRKKSIAAPTASRADESERFARGGAAADPDSSNPNTELVDKLVTAGLNKADAVRLAATDPDECRRQLLYLPFVGTFKTSAGAYLRTGIEQGFAAPKGYEEARAAEAAAAAVAERKRAQAERREKGTDQVPSTEDRLRDRVESERRRIEAEEPERWARLVATAEAGMPQGVLRKKGAAYTRMLAENLRTFVAADLAAGQFEEPAN